MSPQPRCALTVLIPFYNEAGNIAPLLDEVHAALAGIDYEVVCVNDCSNDATGPELVAAAAAHPGRIVVLTHVKRRGKSAALMTEWLMVQTAHAPDHGRLELRPFQLGWPQLPQ